MAPFYCMVVSTSAAVQITRDAPLGELQRRELAEDNLHLGIRTAMWIFGGETWRNNIAALMDGIGWQHTEIPRLAK